MRRAIVLSTDYNGLNVARALGRRGVPVIALDSRPSIGRFTRYAEFQLCPDPLDSEKEFVDHLLRLGRSFDEKPVLFPTNDHWVSAISRQKDALAERFIPGVSDWPVVERILRKQQFYDWGAERAYPVPRSWRADRLREIPDDAFPLAAKPEYRRLSGSDGGARERARQLDEMRLVRLSTRKDAERFLRSFPFLAPRYLFQEYIRGLSDSVYCVGIYADRDGRVRGLFSGRKVRGFPPEIGDCVVGQSEPVPESVKDVVRKMCREIGYHGIAEFEFKRDAETGVFKLLEINPRSWSWIGITPAAGIDLPWIAYSDLAGLGSAGYVESAAPSGSVKYAKLVEDFVNCMYANRIQGYPQWDLSLTAWWRSLRADRLVCAEFAWDDPFPGIYVLGRVAAQVSSSAIRKSKKMLGRLSQDLTGSFRRGRLASR